MVHSYNTSNDLSSDPASDPSNGLSIDPMSPGSVTVIPRFELMNTGSCTLPLSAARAGGAASALKLCQDAATELADGLQLEIGSGARVGRLWLGKREVVAEDDKQTEVFRRMLYRMFHRMFHRVFH